MIQNLLDDMKMGSILISSNLINEMILLMANTPYNTIGKTRKAMSQILSLLKMLPTEGIHINLQVIYNLLYLCGIKQWYSKQLEIITIAQDYLYINIKKTKMRAIVYQTRSFHANNTTQYIQQTIDTIQQQILPQQSLNKYEYESIIMSLKPLKLKTKLSLIDFYLKKFIADYHSYHLILECITYNDYIANDDQLQLQLAAIHQFSTHMLTLNQQSLHINTICLLIKQCIYQSSLSANTIYHDHQYHYNYQLAQSYFKQLKQIPTLEIMILMMRITLYNNKIEEYQLYKQQTIELLKYLPMIKYATIEQYCQYHQYDYDEFIAYHSLIDDHQVQVVIDIKPYIIAKHLYQDLTQLHH